MGAIRNRMVVRLPDGELLKGYAHDFFPNRDVFHLKRLDAEGEEIETREIRLEDVHAIFFVRDFAFERDDHFEEPPEGYVEDASSAGSRKILVTFTWGERLEGTTYGYSPSRPGFFVHPTEPVYHAWNIVRVYVRREAVDTVEFP
ncbi:MAG: hypothetical protein R3326_09715 [Gemmatimonadota bacterium]|nr:hypothetical protein [Gemmatimonadota bacterium]